MQRVCQEKRIEENGTKTGRRKKNLIMINIADVKSHFSKGVSFGELGTNVWLRLSSKFSLFAKIKKVSSVAGTETSPCPFMTSVVQPASLMTKH